MRERSEDINVLDENLVKQYEANLAWARKLYEDTYSEDVVYLATVQDYPLPRRISGHSFMRNKDVVSGQVGSGKAASDHGNHQAEQWKLWAKGVDQSPEKLAEAGEFLQALKRQKKSFELAKEECIRLENKNRARKHSPNTEKRHRDQKEEEREVKKARKYEKFLEKKRTEFSFVDGLSKKMSGFSIGE